MIDNKNIFLKKKILIYGLGKSGISSYRFLKNKAKVYLFDEGGQVLSSEDFSEFLVKQRDIGVRQQTFVIGGAFGFCQSLKKDVDGMISLGRMVWPHFLARVLVLEQVYRAASLMTGSPYHK